MESASHFLCVQQEFVPVGVNKAGFLVAIAVAIGVADEIEGERDHL